MQDKPNRYKPGGTKKNYPCTAIISVYTAPISHARSAKINYAQQEAWLIIQNRESDKLLKLILSTRGSAPKAEYRSPCSWGL
jgi:hypothetical protein